MLTERADYRRTDAQRLVRAVVVSIAVNLLAWIAVAEVGNVLPEAPVPPEIVASVQRIQIVRRPAPSPVPTAAPTARPKPPRITIRRPNAPLAPAVPPATATIALPTYWKTTYMGSARVNDRDVRLYLDWSHQSAEFVPRIFIWHRTIDALDPREVSLRDAVGGILTQLKDEGNVRFYASRAVSVCGGRYPGWFLSYDKLDGDPKIHIDDMLLLARGSVYRATYVRTLDEPENAQTREALRSLC